MKKLVFGLLCMFLFGCVNLPEGCTGEGKVCLDGTVVGRSGPDCEFDKCPDFVGCSAEESCPEGYDCFSFPRDVYGFICAKPNPCEYYSCPDGTGCVVMESYPAIVWCSEVE